MTSGRFQERQSAPSQSEKRIVEILQGETYGLSANELYLAVMSVLSFDVFRQVLDIMARNGQIVKIGRMYLARRVI